MSDTTRNPVSEEISNRYTVDDQWIISREEREMALHLRAAIQEIDRLQDALNEMGGTVEEALEKEQLNLTSLIDVWQQSSDIIKQDGRKLRNAAQSFVTQYDKIVDK